MVRSSGTGTTTNYLTLVLGDGSMSYTFKTSKGTAKQTFDGISLDNDTWNHIALAQQGTNVLLYVNGKTAGQYTLDVAMTPSDLGKTRRNYLGYPRSDSETYCSHVYDDFRIYNEALTADDIALLAQGKEATGITNVRINGQKMSGAVYTIDGRKVSDDLSKTGRLPKGLYVTNGRKFVVK